MTINAKITVAKAKDSLSIDSQAFMIDGTALEKVAKVLGYSYKKLEPSEKKNFEKEHSDKQIKYVWISYDKAFEEKAITLGITDDINFEVTSGLDESDRVIIDIEESDDMAKVYKKMFNKF